jgi:organic hydroperoxide reductase OsmC/OhrA
MATGKTYKSFHYSNSLVWDSARRGHTSAPGKPDIEIGSPPEFKGEAGVWAPEEMLVAALNACMMLTFVAFAQGKKLAFVAYESAAEGLLENVDGKYRIVEVSVQPIVGPEQRGRYRGRPNDHGRGEGKLLHFELDHRRRETGRRSLSWHPMSPPSVAGPPDQEPWGEQKARRGLPPAVRRRLRDQKSPAGHDRRGDKLQHDANQQGRCHSRCSTP